MRLSPVLSGTVVLLLMLSSCQSVSSDSSVSSGTRSQTGIPATPATPVSAAAVLWTGPLAGENWMEQWGMREEKSWGLENLAVIPGPDGQPILRVQYPAGSASPSVSREVGVPIGGTQFYADLNLPPQTALRLSYSVRFSEDFDFVKGGKLPGLFGGTGASGGEIPNGTDGFSTRLMWRRNGEGELYAYLPTSEEHGTSIGRGNWRFQPGVWHRVEQEVILNQPDEANGRIRVWFDGVQVIDETGLFFRSVDTLTIDGLFFSTFFGGGDPSWSTPRTVYADFADFSVSAIAAEN